MTPTHPIGLCIHPANKTSFAYGRFLGQQETIRKGDDVYASDDGRWHNCDRSWQGMLIQDLPGCVVVRLVCLPHD